MVQSSDEKSLLQQKRIKLDHVEETKRNPAPEKTMPVNPLTASINFVQDAAGYLTTKLRNLPKDLDEGKEILIQDWSAKSVLGLI